MKKIITLFIFILSFSFVFATTTKLDGNENGHSYSVLKIKLDGKSKIVTPAVEDGQTPQSLKTLMNRVGGTHAINGGFFCPEGYNRCDGPSSDGLRIFEGTFYSKYGKDIAPNKTVFGFNEEGEPMPLVERDNRFWENGGRENNGFLGMHNGMMMDTLVKEGINVAVLSNMNSDSKQSKAANKTFICSTKDNSTVYMGYVDGVTFSSIADYIIETFNCYNAILLDNGGTKAMIYNNEYVAGPGRNMMDAFVVIEGDNIGANIEQIDENYVVDTDNEKLENAILWMHNAGLTMYDNIQDFLPDNNMTREEASKFFSVFAKNEFGLTEKNTYSCNFSDIKKSDPTLVPSIQSSCKLGIFKGYKNNFMFRDKLTNAQAITVLMRIMFGSMPEPDKAYYTNYLLKAKEIGLVDGIDVNKNITRGEAAIMLYDASIYREEIEGTNSNSNTQDDDTETQNNNTNTQDNETEQKGCSATELLICITASDYYACMKECE